MFLYKDEYHDWFGKWGCFAQWIGSLLAVSNFFLNDVLRSKVFVLGLMIFSIGWIFEIIGRANVIFWIKVKNHPDLAYNWFINNEEWKVIEDKLPANFRQMFPKDMWIGPFRLCVPCLNGKIIYIFAINKKYKITIPDFIRLVQSIEN